MYNIKKISTNSKKAYCNLNLNSRAKYKFPRYINKKYKKDKDLISINTFCQ